MFPGDAPLISRIEKTDRLPERDTFSLCLLASGSKGNCVWVQAGKTSLVIDCGISVKQLRQRAESVGANPQGLGGVLLSHDHGDHIGGIPRLLDALNLDLYTHHIVMRRSRHLAAEGTPREYGWGECFEVGGLEITALPLPHDANGTCGFLFSYQGRTAAHLTDLGHVPPALRQALMEVELLSIESNHDERMLEEGPYPEFLKKRVASQVGHLSNAACAELVADLAVEGRLQHAVLAHLSETNNTPEMAYRTVRETLDAAGHTDVQISLSAQRTPSGVFSFL